MLGQASNSIELAPSHIGTDNHEHSQNQAPTWLDSTVSGLVQARNRENPLSSSITSITSNATDYSDYDSSASFIITSLSVRRFNTFGNMGKVNMLLGLFEAVSEVPRVSPPRTLTFRQLSFTSQIDRLIYEQYSERHIPLPPSCDPGSILRVTLHESMMDAPTPPPIASFDVDPSEVEQNENLGESWEIVPDKPSLCTICLGPLCPSNGPCSSTETLTLTLPCNHTFHRTCISTWLGGERSEKECWTNRCPTCNCTLALDFSSHPQPRSNSLDDAPISEDSMNNEMLSLALELDGIPIQDGGDEGGEEDGEAQLICSGLITPPPSPVHNGPGAVGWRDTVEDPLNLSTSTMPMSVFRAVEEYRRRRGKEEEEEEQSISDISEHSDWGA